MATQTPNQTPKKEFVTQEKKASRKGWPVWAKQFPRLNFPPQNDAFQLIKKEELEALLKSKGATEEASKRLLDDIDFLEQELLRLFRKRDYRASYNQNRYRTYQMAFMGLATLATLVGSFQALALNTIPDWLPMFAFAETVVALATTYIATISSRETPLPTWLMNRRRAEYLRREYFRFLMDLPPYNDLSSFERKQRLSIRAANINRGVYPDKSAD
ncbi:MAG: DUF4231 domain-containing protein [Chloroflexota bacterium]